MKNDLIQIAIDGPASSGKSTVAQIVASRLSISYLSTGKIFRSYAFVLKDIDCKNHDEVINDLRDIKLEFKNSEFFINGLNATSEIGRDCYSIPASVISAYPEVRERYQEDLKEILKTTSIVMDGRDIGTVILPNTPYKYFLDAKSVVRAERRAKQNGIALNSEAYKDILAEIKLRDKQDTERKEAPLKQAKDALYIDSTKITAEQVADIIYKDVQEKMAKLGMK